MVVVTHNAGTKLYTWLESVEKLDEPKNFCVRPVIVDNASSDFTPRIIGNAIRKGKLAKEDVHWLPANYGFAAAQNVVFRSLIAEGKCKYVATLNEDATADRYWLSRLVGAAISDKSKRNNAGIWGSLIICPDGGRNVVSSAGHWLRKDDAAFLDIDRKLKCRSQSLHYKRKRFEPFSPCFAAALWSLEMMRKVGLPDSDQFMYYDDVDLAFRARIKGWHAEFIPRAKAYHPLPMPKAVGSRMWRYQQKGRLAMIRRYLPDSERKRILSSLNIYLKNIYIELLNEGRDLRPVGSNK